MCCIDVQCTEWRWNIPYRGGDGMYHVTMEAEVECTVLRRSVLRGNGGGGRLNASVPYYVIAQCLLWLEDTLGTRKHFLYDGEDISGRKSI